MHYSIMELDRTDSLLRQCYEQNRILRVGALVSITVRSHVDTGERNNGDPIWILRLSVEPEFGAPYSVQTRQIVSTYSMAAFADGMVLTGRVDPDDPYRVAFGDEPYL